MAQALYRKYRSKSLQEVVGQGHITDTLSLALKNSGTSHAYLFTGPRGVGKTSVARILAHEINKIPYTEEGQHLDIIEIDAASNRRIDDIRDLRDKVHIAPVSASHKVYIIDEVHMLTGESFNALLKTLEEPPAHVVFILATTEVHKLPATIVSRTQRFHFRPVSKEKVIAHLKYIADQEKISIDEESLALVAEYGEGSFRDSISLLDQLASMSGGKIDRSFVEQSLGLASSATVRRLVDLLQSSSRVQLHEELVALEAQGVNPTTLSRQLIQALKQEALQNPSFYALIESLLDINKSPQPDLKLLVTLLSFISPDFEKPVQTPQKTAPERVAAPVVHTVTQKPAQQKEERKTTSKTTQPKATSTDKPATPAASQKNDGKPLHPEHWGEVLSEMKRTNPPVFSIIKKAEPRFEDDNLTLAFSFKLHQIKLEDARYRAKFIECINGLGYKCPALYVIHDSDAMAPVIELTEGPVPETDETAASVLAMMGGGDVVNA